MKLLSSRGARAFAAVTVLAGFATLAQARAVHIELHATASAQAEEVLLSDIATISNADAATLARLAALDVGRVAADGKATLVDRAALARWVQARTGVLSSDVVWSGAARCNVRIADASASPAGASALPHGAAEPARAVATLPAASVAHPAVVRGNLASLRSVSGAIALESRVEVLDDGVVGQDVRVRMPGANEAIVARVTAPGRVEVSQ